MTKRVVLGALALVSFPALFQLFVHPILSGGSFSTWALFWVYTTFGVIVPGTLLALRALAWRADLLSWLGVGWALGHGFELVALLIGRELGDGRIGLLWIPIAYGIAISSRGLSRELPNVLAPIPEVRRCAIALVLLMSLGGGLFFAISLPEISIAPPFISDPWFHVGNAHEFRDHSPMQDPRLAGDPFNYHVFGYAASAAASLATGQAVAPILLRYSGMACVFLFTLNLFNCGRTMRGGGVVAGAIGTAIILFPLELGPIIMPEIAFGAGVMFFGTYLSTTTLAGQVFLVPLLILVREHYRKCEWRNAWALCLLAFAGAGSKAMFGPVILCAAAGVAGWKILFDRRFERESIGMFLILLLGVAPPTLMLLFGEASYAPSVQWTPGAFLRHTPYFSALREWGVPVFVILAFWIPGFCAPLLLGAVLARIRIRRAGEDGDYQVFVWMALIAALVPALWIELLGSSQLFFLYFAQTALATIAGVGWVALFRSRFIVSVLAFSFAFWLLLQAMVGFTGRFVLLDHRVINIWSRTNWWSYAVPHRDQLLEAPRSQPRTTSPYVRKISLTPDVADALEWARRNLPGDTVFAVNVQSGSVYGALSECRAFLDVTDFNARSHVARSQGSSRGIFAPRRALLDAWVQGRPRFVADLRSAGVTHLFVDRVNGRNVSVDHPDLEGPIFENPDFMIFDIRSPR